jgi:hypothetical protein
MTRMMRMRAGSLVAAMTVLEKPRPQAGTVSEKIASEFSRLAGSKDKALALIDQLRGGTLAPTGPMGWMDVKITLVLVQDSLARAGKASPHAEELDASLKSVLRLRANGMGWGRIAFVTAGSGDSRREAGKGKGGG